MESTDLFLSGLAKNIAMPDVLKNIRLLMANPHSKISDFVRVIQSSPQLTNSVIRFANSNFFGFDSKTDSLNEAISSMGVGLLHDVLLGSFCLHTFRNHNHDQIINFDDFWRQQIKQGIAAHAIAKYCHIPGSYRFFSIGLLLEIGHAAMFLKAPELTLKALRESARQNLAIDSIERIHFGFDHCQLGAKLCHHWHLPAIYQETIEHYLYPSRVKPAFRKEADIAHLAHHLCAPSSPGIQLDLKLLNGHERLMVKNLVAKEITLHLDEVHIILNSFDDR